jgi:ABC-type multidrug transport system fused ATPase/permease subunit
MVMSAPRSWRGEQTIGDFVLINALLMQLSIPLNFIGFVYREIKQGLTDIEQMFDLLDVRPRSSTARARSRSRRGGRRPLRGRAFPLRPGPADPEGRLLRGAGRQDGRHRRAVGRRQVDHLAAALPLLRRPGRARSPSTGRMCAT